MRVEGLAGAIRGATTRTTKADPAAARPEDLVDRKFNAQRLDDGCASLIWPHLEG
jgi:putative transposase